MRLSCIFLTRIWNTKQFWYIIVFLFVIKTKKTWSYFPFQTAKSLWLQWTSRMYRKSCRWGFGESENQMCSSKVCLRNIWKNHVDEDTQKRLVNEFYYLILCFLAFKNIVIVFWLLTNYNIFSIILKHNICLYVWKMLLSYHRNNKFS